MKKSITIFLYLVTLYYLLPFRPGYLYYIAQCSTYASQTKAINNKAESQFSEKKSFSNNKIFTKKDRSRFDFDASLAITISNNEFKFFFTTNSYSDQLFDHYSDPATRYNSNRGPPIS